jgi:DGQHR domain-containing protein
MSEFQCAAIPVRQPSGTFYVAAVKVAELETICRPLARPAGSGLFGRETAESVPLSERQLSDLVRSLESSKFQSRANRLLSEEREQPYQRFLDEKRSVEIARYLEQPTSLLPNSIILAVNIDLDEAEVIRAHGEQVKVILPRLDNSAVILDGQHRVAAFRYLSDEKRHGFEVLVAFLVGIPFYQQAELFAIINGTQKRVNRSIIYDLFGYASSKGANEDRLYEGLMAVSRFSSHVARIVNRVPESPWQSKIRMRGPGDEGVISQAAVVEYLSSLVEPKAFSKRLKIFPLLYSFFKETDSPGCASLLILYLRAIQSAIPDVWNNSKSLLWKNNGVAVMLRILHDELVIAGSPEALMDGFHSIVARWKKAPQELLLDPPKTGGGGVQNQLYEKFKAAMFSNFEVQELADKREHLKEKLLKLGALVA